MHREGRVNTAKNLLRYLTVDANGPRLPGVSVRVFRRKLRQMGLFFGKTKKVLAAEMSKPYIRRWRVSYCRGRAAQLNDGKPRRPRARTGATFVDKWATRDRGWLARDASDGDEIQDANKGGRGEALLFCTHLRAM